MAYKRKTGQWVTELVDRLISDPEPDWFLFFTSLQEYFWCLKHNLTNKGLFVKALAARMKGVRIER
jgi:hypothetical protein